MAYSDSILADAPYIYLPFTGNSVSVNNGSKTGMTATSAGIAWATGLPTTGTSANFNTTSSHIQYTVGTDNILGSPQWSAEIWVKKGTLTTWANIIHREENPAGGRNQFVLRVDAAGSTHANKITLVVVRNGVSTALVGPVLDTAWHHVAATSDGTTMRLYVDGVEVANAAAVAPIFTNSTWRLGAYGTTAGNENWVGQMDEVAIYKTSLSAERVLAHYNSGMGHIAVAASAMAMIETTPNPVVTAVDSYRQTLAVTADAGYGVSGSGSGVTTLSNATVTPISLGYTVNTGAAAIKFANPVMPENGAVKSANLHIYLTRTGTQEIRVYRNTSDWVETNGTASPTVSETDYTTITLPSGSASGAAVEFVIDITPIAQAWAQGAPNYGVSVKNLGTYTPDVTYISKESASNKATLAMEIVATTHSVNTPNPMLSTINTPAPGITTTSNIQLSTSPMALSLGSPNAAVDIVNPDYAGVAGPMAMELTTPEAEVTAGSDLVVVVNGPMALSLAAREGVTFNSQTDRKIVASPMALALDWPTYYYEAAQDRYLKIIGDTIDADDVWYAMDETSGTVAQDSVVGLSNDTVPVNIWESDGTYRGNPTLNVNGPYGRKAVRFDGVDDYLEVGPYTMFAGRNDTSLSPYSDITIEFSIKTTQQNGVVFTGLDRSAGVSVENKKLTEFRLIDGELYFIAAPYGVGANQTFFRVRKNIADGQWHHVVFSWKFNDTTGGIVYASEPDPVYVMIDGVIELTRYGLPGGIDFGKNLTPFSIMARKDHRTNVVTDNLKGDMRDFIIRANRYIKRDLAQKLYYEWSMTTLVNPEPMRLSLSSVNPEDARGNVKKMLVVYGIGDGGIQGTTYYSQSAGYFVEAVDGERNTPFGVVDEQFGTPIYSPFRSGFGYGFYRVVPFYLNGYLCYPVSIYGGDRSAPGSAEGILNGEYFDKMEGSNRFVDDRSGLPRFIDFDLDLNGDITDFDTVTVVNYPNYAPEYDGDENLSGPLHGTPGAQWSMGLRDFEWIKAREAFRNTLLRAGNKGVNLWVTDPEMALDLGYIQGYDIHGPAGFAENASLVNTAGQNIDREHMLPTSDRDKEGSRIGWRGMVAPDSGQYISNWQTNMYRRIVALEDGLTDIPSWDVVEGISLVKDDLLALHARQTAYDIIERPNGLSVGDRMKLSVAIGNDVGYNTPTSQASIEIGTTASPLRPIPSRQTIVSARPDGIVGKVLSKEMTSYYGPNGRVVQNPYANNVYTIAAEIGHTVRGITINARAFIELMDMDTRTYAYPVDVDKGTTSTWSYDTKRNKESAAVAYLSKKTTRNGVPVEVQTEIRYITVEGVTMGFVPHYSMNQRGLLWMSGLVPLSDGEVRINAAAMELNVSGGNPTVTANRANSVRVPPMNVYLELRKPRNVEDKDVEVSATPMTMSLTLTGLGKTIAVPPMELTLSMPAPLSDVPVDLIQVFMDEDRTITLFLKEDD